MKKMIIFLFLLFVFLYPIPYTLYPVYAQIDIGKEFGFGQITSFGKITSLILPAIFSIATFLVILYFLLGAFKYLKAGGNKEEVEGGKQMITHAIIGFIILVFAFLVIQFLLSSVFGPETGGFVNIFKQ